MNLEEIMAAFPEEGFLQADGFEEAIIGVERESMRLVYSVEKCIEIRMKDYGDDVEEGDDPRTMAIEDLEFNTFGAYMGEKTPIWAHTEEY
jgi:hypothetical protein